MRFHTSVSISTDGWLTAKVEQPVTKGMASVDLPNWAVFIRGAEQYGPHLYVTCACEAEVRALADAINAVYARQAAEKAA